MAVNHVACSGNIGTDVEVRQTTTGTSVLTFRLAIQDRKPDGNGGYVDYAHWVDVCMFDKNGRRVDYFSKHLHKGKKVFVTGRLNYSQWERDGERRSKLEIVADDFDFERPPRDQQNGGSGTYTHGYQNARQTPSQAPTGGVVRQRVQELANPPQAGDIYSEDIPF